MPKEKQKTVFNDRIIERLEVSLQDHFIPYIYPDEKKEDYCSYRYRTNMKSFERKLDKKDSTKTDKRFDYSDNWNDND